MIVGTGFFYLYGVGLRQGCSTRNKVVGLEFALTVKYAFPRSHFLKIFLLTMSAKVHLGYRFLAIINRKTGLENHVLER
ncbi:hypothetical protein Hanom_Chr10g00912621 [Helianthus anomalus]